MGSWNKRKSLNVIIIFFLVLLIVVVPVFSENEFSNPNHKSEILKGNEASSGTFYPNEGSSETSSGTFYPNEGSSETSSGTFYPNEGSSETTYPELRDIYELILKEIREIKYKDENYDGPVKDVPLTAEEKKAIIDLKIKLDEMDRRMSVENELKHDVSPDSDVKGGSGAWTITGKYYDEYGNEYEVVNGVFSGSGSVFISADSVIIRDVTSLDIDFILTNLGVSDLTMNNGNPNFRLNSRGNSISTIVFDDTEINFTGSLLLDVNNGNVIINGDNVSIATIDNRGNNSINETLIGEVDAKILLNGGIDYVEIGKNSRYEFNGDDNCKTPISIYNPVNRGHQIYLFKHRNQNYETNCDYCSYLNFMTNTYTVNHRVRVERKSVVSIGWDTVINSRCDETEINLEMDKCFTSANMTFDYMNETAKEINQDENCLNALSGDFEINQIGNRTIGNINSIETDLFIKSFSSLLTSRVNISETELTNEFIRINAPNEDSNNEILLETFWERLIKNFKEIIRQQI